jgi:hypothetical protein
MSRRPRKPSDRGAAPRAGAPAARAVTTPVVPEDGVLGLAVATPYVPGTNLKGQVAGAAWTLLLPRLELGRVVCLGVPSAATLVTLARRADELTVVAGDARRSARARAAMDRGELPRATVADAADALRDVHPDLLVVTSPRWARRLAREPALRALRSPDGSVFAELGGAHAVGAGRARRLAAELGAGTPLVLTPGSGEARTAAATDDPRTVAFLARGAAPAAARARAELKRLVRQARDERRVRLARSGGRRLAALAAAGDRDEGRRRPPAYVRDMARAAGIDLDGFGAGLAAPSDYASRKALLFLFAGGAAEPRYVVKLTREPALNHRLENEWRGLVALRDAGIGDEATVPRPAFSGHPAGLAVVAQTAIAGVPLRDLTTGRADCPSALRAVGWLEDLAAATADTTAATAADAGGALRRLHERFAEIYPLPPAQAELLAAQVEAVAGSRSPFPVVLQHGDPGVWNLLVTADGRPAFLDWEATETRGMPLWDLLYYLRSFSVLVGRRQGTRDALAAFAAQYLEGGPLGAVMAGAVERACARTGLEPGLALPLLLTCWMHRALKEATRLPQHRLAQGHYVRLLSLCLERHADLPLPPPAAGAGSAAALRSAG